MHRIFSYAKTTWINCRVYTAKTKVWIWGITRDYFSSEKCVSLRQLSSTMGLSFSNSNSNNSSKGDSKLQIASAFAKRRYLSYTYFAAAIANVWVVHLPVSLLSCDLLIRARKKAREQKRIAARHNRKSNRPEVSRVQDISLNTFDDLTDKGIYMSPSIFLYLWRFRYIHLQ